jgi:hypothetical protein
MVTMSQKSSVPQAAKSVSQALTSDTMEVLLRHASSPFRHDRMREAGKSSIARGKIKRGHCEIQNDQRTEGNPSLPLLWPRRIVGWLITTAI